MGILAIGLSVILAFWTCTTAQFVPVFGDFSLPLADTSTWLLSVGGFILTPIITIAAVAWDQVAQRRGLRNRNFGLKPVYGTALRIIAAGGFGLALWHILNLANAVAGGA